jgi:hypothetical protein
MGGSADPAVHDQSNLITLCRPCHRKIHEGRWELERSPEMVRVLDRDSGQQVMRRLYNPGLDIPQLFHSLNLTEAFLARLQEALPYMSDDQLVEVFAYARSLGKRLWLVQAAVFYEAQQRSIYGDRSLEAIARRFEISLRQAQKYALVWKVFFAGDGQQENVDVDAIVLDEPSWYVVAASETEKPEQWLAYAQDRKQEDPSYSISNFRRDILTAKVAEPNSHGDGDTKGQARPAGLPELGPRPCPWVRAFCTRSGKPIQLEQCGDCEFRGTKESQEV